MTGMWIALASAAASPIWTVSSALGPVQHGLAVEADDVDVVERCRFCAVKSATASACAAVTTRSASRRQPGRAVAMRQVDGLDTAPGAAGRAPGRCRADSRTVRTPSPGWPSVSIKATSTPSSEVPLIRPMCGQHHRQSVPLQHPVRSSRRRRSACAKHGHLIMPQRPRLRQPVPARVPGFRYNHSEKRMIRVAHHDRL